MTDNEETMFVGQKIVGIREATEEEAESIKHPEDEPLMMIDLENGAKIFCISEATEEKGEERQYTLGETDEGETVEIDE